MTSASCVPVLRASKGGGGGVQNEFRFAVLVVRTLTLAHDLDLGSLSLLGRAGEWLNCFSRTSACGEGGAMSKRSVFAVKAREHVTNQDGGERSKD